jgi:hypothetical protein
VLLLLVPAAAVVWLGVRLVIQDRQLESEQLRKQREIAADEVVGRRQWVSKDGIAGPGSKGVLLHGSHQPPGNLGARELPALGN